MLMLQRSASIAGVVGLALAVAPVATAQDVVLDFNQALLDAIADTSTPPPAATRAMAIVHVAVHDAVVGIDRRHEAFLVETNPPLASIEAAAAQAAFETLVALFPSREVEFRTVLDAALAALPAGPARDAGVAHGSAVAASVLADRATDGFDATSPYEPTAIPGRWRPTPPDFTPPLLPQWASLRPFAMTSPDQFRPVPPLDITTPEYARSLAEVQEIGKVDSATRTADQTEIAIIWEGGAGTVTPPGHWNAIARTIAAQEGNGLIDNARLLGRLNVTLADAAICSWECKYGTDYWRPVTAIREADTDGNPLTVQDPTWLPLLPTPPFPTYTSGHSTFSGSGSTAIARFFGRDDFNFTFEAEGLSRDFTSLSEAADEAGISRIYGGIHYDFDNIEGLSSGRALGNYIADGFFAKRCRSDLDGDGALTLFDALAFQNAYETGAAAADFTSDGELTVADYLRFIDDFTAGCP
jgi:hypothetical protein